MYFDSSFTLNGAEVGVDLISPKGDQLLYVIWLHFHVTNNVAEYEALVNDVRITAKLRVQRLYICGDFELIINQVMGLSNCRALCIAAYHQEVRKLEEKFDGFELHHILRHDNEAANTLARLKSSHGQSLPGVFIQDLIKSSVRLDEDDLVPMLGTRLETICVLYKSVVCDLFWRLPI
jgi:ribonuclease HI